MKLSRCLLQEQIQEKLIFKKLNIPGLAKKQEVARKEFKRPHPIARSNQIIEKNVDWCNVWPSQQTFNHALIPFPIRQGHVRNFTENNNVSPGKYANAELIKVPNFLHLTPPHIKRHCAAFKKYCTEWPTELVGASDAEIAALFPLEVTHSDYVHSHASIRDERSPRVSLRFNVAHLQLDPRARHKFMQLCAAASHTRQRALLKQRYGLTHYANLTKESRATHGPVDRIVELHNWESKEQQKGEPQERLMRTQKHVMVEMSSSRCPVKRQNYEYLIYVLTALSFETKKEKWDDEKTENDYEQFCWEKSVAKKHIQRFFETTPPPHSLDNYKRALSNLFVEESAENLDKYAQSVMALLIPAHSPATQSSPSPSQNK